MGQQPQYSHWRPEAHGFQTGFAGDLGEQFECVGNSCFLVWGSRIRDNAHIASAALQRLYPARSKSLDTTSKPFCEGRYLGRYNRTQHAGRRLGSTLRSWDTVSTTSGGVRQGRAPCVDVSVVVRLCRRVLRRLCDARTVAPSGDVAGYPSATTSDASCRALGWSACSSPQK